MPIAHLVAARLFAHVDRLLRAERGAVSVEYIAVFGFVTIGMTVALVKLGPNLFAAWGQTQTVLMASKP